MVSCLRSSAFICGCIFASGIPRRAQRPSRERHGEVPPILRARVEITVELDIRGRRFRCIPDALLLQLRPRQPSRTNGERARHRSAATQPQARPDAPAIGSQSNLGSGCDHREITMPPADLDEIGSHA